MKSNLSNFQMSSGINFKNEHCLKALSMTGVSGAGIARSFPWRPIPSEHRVFYEICMFDLISFYVVSIPLLADVLNTKGGDVKEHIDSLEEKGFIKNVCRGWKLTEKGRKTRTYYLVKLAADTANAAAADSHSDDNEIIIINPEAEYKKLDIKADMDIFYKNILLQEISEEINELMKIQSERRKRK